MNDTGEIEVLREEQGDATILRPVGDIDLARAPALRVHLTSALSSAPQRLIVDLGQVPYMDSSGVATFVEAMQVARRGGTKLILCGLQERVRSIFEIARLDMIFTILSDTDEALAH